ncbi:MAG: hypothetical protein ACXACA_02675 [Candidatus Ranarchaeia archaeon]|jgi:hypothetical protein
MKIRKIGVILGLKGVLAVSSLMTIAVALVVYSASVTVTPIQQFTIGSSSDSWTIYVNEVNQTRYLPGGTSQPVFDSGDTGTYAFRVVTDTDKVCAVRIELTSAMDSGKFSNFDITVDYWTGATWASATLYDSATGSTTITEIDGLSAGAAGYIHQGLSTTTYYLVKVTYSYDIVDDLTQRPWSKFWRISTVKAKYLKIRMVLGCISLFVGLLAANFALFGWSTPDGFLYFLGEYAHYVCAFGGFGAIIFGSMLINDFLVRNHDLRSQALWYQETVFEEGTVFLGEFFLDDEEEKEIATKKI